MRHIRFSMTMAVSIQTLRPNMELWRAHRRRLTDSWVGPGVDRIDELGYAPGNESLHRPGFMLGTLELRLKFKKAS
ncbi:MAG: hypothetical protein O7E57_15980 [Gammaproteobacteria bacterium]|nr:hypothetical protein [Gammaproteobacteria bacterium]